MTGSPAHGDLAVFSWAPYGHVAVISGVNGDGSINVWEQVCSSQQQVRLISVIIVLSLLDRS